MSSHSSPEDPTPRALPGGENQAPALRGEVFDLEAQIESEAEKRAKSRAGAYFFAALAILFGVYNFGAYVGQKSAPPAAQSFTFQAQKLPDLRVQVVGRVKKPGVYALPGGARLEDALKKAGGALPDANLGAFNLADWAVDGSKIEVPSRQSPKIAPTPTPIVIIKEVVVQAPQNAPEEAQSAMPNAGLDKLAPPNASASAPKSTPRPKEPRGKSSPDALALLRKNPVDLNKASAEQLSVLPGVGPKMAERILDYRTENGGFKSVADLDNVKGIGEKRMEVLKDLVKVK